MKQLIALIIAVWIASPVLAQTSSGRKNYFAVGLFTGAHSGIITYAIVSFQGTTCIGAQLLTEERFMYEVMGHYPSMANPKRENLLYRNGVDSCFLVRNEYDKVVGYYCKPFFDLWKIRFYEHPMQFDTPGWSQGRTTPSRWQREFLYREYGVTNVLLDYFYGDSLYKLLRDVQDPEWVSSYRFMVDSTAQDTTSNGNP